MDSYLAGYGTRQDHAAVDCLDDCVWSEPDVPRNDAEMAPEEDDARNWQKESDIPPDEREAFQRASKEDPP